MGIDDILKECRKPGKMDPAVVYGRPKQLTDTFAPDDYVKVRGLSRSEAAHIIEHELIKNGQFLRRGDGKSLRSLLIHYSLCMAVDALTGN